MAEVLKWGYIASKSHLPKNIEQHLGTFWNITNGQVIHK